MTGCSGISVPDNQKLGRLTPYITQENGIATAEMEPHITENFSTYAPTATPIIHVVALGETISSIALLYGLPMDVIMKANPDAKPNALIVGDELVIPTSGGLHTAAVDPAILENIVIHNPNCIQTRDEGLWCAVLVKNHGKEILENIIVTFSFRDSDGNVVEERSAPGLMRFAFPGKDIPAAVFLENIPANYAGVTAKILSAQIIDEVQSPFLTVEIKEETQALNGLEATIHGSMRVEAEQAKDLADISIGAAGFNVDGSLVGVRRLDSSVATNETLKFNISVYSSADNITNVMLYAEAY